ncbi:MAG: DUF3859 domain-containing protein [Xanthobacteraceae bacterium]|nr:DUF3859 domain-containing protein [Xanthobacteraceae bacterium]QYK46036.1 MAG: DUF3859 domain-containing protein [Xanthobacteraceae bacterium]HMN51950.1 DUF3859 domain-containing protein [Xanthobacteraceae bacterium]
MRRILAAGAVLFFAMAAQANAQVRGFETWYGLYTVEGVQIVDDPSAPSGKRRVGGRIKEPAQNSDRIQLTPGSYFGFGYVLQDSGGATSVQVRHVQLIPPPGITDNQGRVHDSLQSDLNLSTNRDLFIGISMGERTVKGVWTMQVWEGGRVLLERKFTLY